MPNGPDNNLTIGDWREWMGSVNARLSNIEGVLKKLNSIDSRLARAEVRIAFIAGIAALVGGGIISFLLKFIK